MAPVIVVAIYLVALGINVAFTILLRRNNKKHVAILERRIGVAEAKNRMLLDVLTGMGASVDFTVDDMDGGGVSIKGDVVTPGVLSISNPTIKH